MNRKLKRVIAVVLTMMLVLSCTPIGNNDASAAVKTASSNAAAKTQTVKDQKSLNAALKNTKLTTLTVKTDNIVSLSLGKVKRTGLTVIIDAPKATIVNCARLKKITIKQAGAYLEFAYGNTIEIAKSKSAAAMKLTLADASAKTKLINSTGKAFEFTTNTNSRKSLAKGKKYTSASVKFKKQSLSSDVETEEISLYGEEKIRAGQLSFLSANIYPRNAAGSLIFTSSDESVATVNRYGEITGIGKGKAVITASAFNGVSGSFMIQVTDNAPELTYRLTKDKSGYIVTGCKDETSYTVNIPATYKKLPVTGVDSQAFINCDNLRYFTTDKNQKYLYTIDGVLFAKKPVKTMVRIPGNYLYKNGSEYSVPEGTVAIGDYAFANFPTVYQSFTVHVPDSVTTIGDYVFRNLRSSADVYLTESVTSIGKDILLGQNSSLAFFAPLDTYAATYAQENMIPCGGIFEYESKKTDVKTTVPQLSDAKNYKIPKKENITEYTPYSYQQASYMSELLVNEKIDSYRQKNTEEVRLMLGNQGCWGMLLPDKTGRTISRFPNMTGIYGLGYTEKKATLIGYDISGKPLGTMEVKGDFEFAFKGAFSLGIAGGKNTNIIAIPYEPVFVSSTGYLNLEPKLWEESVAGSYMLNVILCYGNSVASSDMPNYMNHVSSNGKDSVGETVYADDVTEHHRLFLYTFNNKKLLNKSGLVSEHYDKIVQNFDNDELTVLMKSSYKTEKDYAQKTYDILTCLKKIMLGKYYPKKQPVSKITVSVNGLFPTTSESQINLDEYSLTFDNETIYTIAHEMTHAIDQSIPLFKNDYYGYDAVWMEGRAEYISSLVLKEMGIDDFKYSYGYDWSFISEEDKADFLNYMLFRQNRETPYPIGYFFIKYLCETYGDDITGKIMANMAKIKVTKDDCMNMSQDEYRELFSSCVTKETSKTVFQDFVRDVINKYLITSE